MVVFIIRSVNKNLSIELKESLDPEQTDIVLLSTICKQIQSLFKFFRSNINTLLLFISFLNRETAKILSTGVTFDFFSYNLIEESQLLTNLENENLSKYLDIFIDKERLCLIQNNYLVCFIILCEF